MKVAIFSESSTDEAALRILVDAILGHASEPVAFASVRSRGWGSVRVNLAAIYKQLHFNSDADALVVVADSDDTPIHDPAHESLGNANRHCRLCILRTAIADVRGQCRPVPNRAPLRTAIGIAVPAIEAWFRAGVDIHVTEQAWARGPGVRTFDRKSLKRDLFGSDQAPLSIMTAKMVVEANRIAADLSMLARLFPSGFGSMLRDIQNW